MSELLSWHRVGMRVVCVDEFPLTCFGAPTEGEVYTISAVYKATWNQKFIGDKCVGDVCLRLRGFPARVGFNAKNFRPVRDTSFDSFRSLLSPTPDDVRRYEEEMEEA